MIKSYDLFLKQQYNLDNILHVSLLEQCRYSVKSFQKIVLLVSLVLCHYDVASSPLRVTYPKSSPHGKDTHVLHFSDDLIMLKLDRLITHKDNNTVNNIFLNFCIIISLIKFVIVKITKCFPKIKIRIIHNTKYTNS